MFAENGPVGLVDALGEFSDCGNACLWALAIGLDGGNAGGVVCCGRRKYTCAWRTGQTLDNSKAVQLALECVYDHEATHYPFVTCGCAAGPTRPPANPNDECGAYEVHLSCLFKKLFGGGCGDDQECTRQLWVEYNYTKGKRDEACRGQRK